MESSESPDRSPEALCPWLSEEDLELIGDLGLPDPYHWGNLQIWTERLLQKYCARISDSRVVRHRFIRTRCILCRHLCEDTGLGSIIDPPVALPCGHIMGWSCYADFCDNYTMGKIPLTCPWNGPQQGDPASWSPACNERIVHDCEHTAIFARIPPPTEEFYIPQGFFMPVDGLVTAKCRRCTIKKLLVRWTREVRQDGEFPHAFAACSGINGLLEGEKAGFGPLVQPGLEDEGAARSRILEELFGSTPTPLDGTELEETSTEVVFFKTATDPDNIK
ncbi:hypothetical protein G7Z17_g4208 [Cylindrodendrum hubeiense]|uniref:Uncharacterized protein n=1 Tax=Cylindrodendrum hubeiense TaxID=595255 RepID=A0A9P5LCU7_9HYPO|nr:hypothetical protein G7Z17_g4208 [Cylindrodendrum hubeiense]